MSDSPLIIANSQTAHPERYLYAPANNPQIVSKTYVCALDGNLVVDLEAHDRDHDLREQAARVAAAPPATPAEPTITKVRITEPAIDVAEVVESVNRAAAKRVGSAANTSPPTKA